MKRLFVPESNFHTNYAVIKGSDIHHIKNVLRKKVGDEIEITDGKGTLYKTIIHKIDSSQILLRIISFSKTSQNKLYIRLFQAIPKGKAFENIIEKVCELGVKEIYPLITERTVVKYEEKRLENKLKKWETLIKEKAKKVGLAYLPSIFTPVEISNIKDYLYHSETKIVFWELEDKASLKSFLSENPLPEKISIVIGPEGGFSISEIELLKASGFKTLSLGRRIYTVEVATIVALSNIIFYYEE